jgi:flagellar basal-body rod modification protein FlgD
MSPTQTVPSTASTDWAIASGTAQPQAAQNNPGQMASKEMFLQLLVAQIRNQNPLNPANGTEFVAQLAQFTQLEATLDIRQEIEQIRAALGAAPQNETQAP